MMLSFTYIIIGVQNYLQEINASLWATAMLQESEAPPPFYDTFKNEATAVLRNDLHMLRDDIT